jgi:RNA polymerase sigma-70 factor (ECF subfamily)
MLELVAETTGSDRELALLIEWAGGNRGSGEALLGLLLPGIHGLCLRILRSSADAEEAAQETFVRLCAKVASGQLLENVRTWAATVAMNLCFDKRRQREKESLVEDVGGVAAPPSEPIHLADLDLLRARFEELPERYRLVLHYSFVLDLKPREIAEVMGLEDGSARVLLHRALEALRRKVAP